VGVLVGLVEVVDELEERELELDVVLVELRVVEVVELVGWAPQLRTGGPGIGYDCPLLLGTPPAP